MEYPINKGAGNPIEFKGLKSQYLFIFAGGLVAVLLMVVILYLAGVSQWICIPLGILSGSLLVWLTFRLNARYGEHGLMKLLAINSSLAFSQSLTGLFICSLISLSSFTR